MHVVALPWSAFGHIIPFLQLSIALAKAGVRVSLVSTPKNIQRLPKLPPDVEALISLVELPLPAVDRALLPQDAEATVDLPFHKIQYLKVAYDLLQHPFKQLVADQSPDWIITDFASPWANHIAQEYGVPLVFFSVLDAVSLVFIGPAEAYGDDQKKVRSTVDSLTSPLEWAPFPSSVAYRSYEAIAMVDMLYGQNASGIRDSERMAKTIRGCQAIAVRSCREYEGDWLDLEAKMTGKPVIPVGLLPPERPKGREFTDESWDVIFKWLEEQNPKSVVFVGFGSECKLSRDQVYEIAMGLEMSGLPFLLALRKPNWAANDVDAMPPGFGHRTSGQGVVHVGWVPQMEILAHPSIGGSLFHSGWGSVIETLQYGHRCVVLPFIIDQGLNARFLVEKGLAIEVERGEDGSFTRADVAKSLRQAMVSEELRSSAREAAAIFGDHSLHEQYICRFVEYLKNGSQIKQTDQL